MKTKRISALSAGLLAFSLAACSGVPGTTSESAADEDLQKLVFAHSVDPRSMDPQNANQTSAERINANMYSRLFTRNADMEIVPQLVTDYEQVDDETWRFTIREDVTFHNGDPLTAADVEFSINRVITDETLLEHSWFRQIESIAATDDYEVEITTDGPMPTLLTLLAKGGSDILPADYIEEHGIDEFIDHPIGSGPYQFVEWRRDDRVILEANPDYWGDAPIWDEVEVRTIPENSTRVSELLTGGVDIIADVPPNDWDRVDSDDTISMEYGDTTRVALLIVRMTDSYVTADEEIREAIDLAIDQGAITESLFEGHAVPVRSRAPIGVFGANEDLYDTFVHDPERAAEIVADAEETPRVTLTASRGNYPFDAEVAEMITAMLEEVGFEVDLVILEGGAFSDMFSEYTNDELYMISLADGLLDASYSLTHYTQARAEGQTDYYDEEVEQLIAEGNRTFDAETRADLYAQAQAIVAEQRPHIPLYVQPAAFGVSDDFVFSPRLDDNLVFDDVRPAQ